MSVGSTRSIRAAAAMAIALATAGSLHAQGPRRDGRWEVTVRMEMPGAPAGLPPMTVTQCVTPEEAKAPDSVLPQAPGTAMPETCKLTDQKVSGNKVSWALMCEGAEAMSGNGELVYTDSSFEGFMKMMHSGQTMTMKYTGKRLGDCTK
jgi:hypothetical protein